MSKKLQYSILSLFSLILVSYAFSSSSFIRDFSILNTSTEEHDTTESIAPIATNTNLQTTFSTCSTIGFPFVENFNNSSTSINCWTIIDGNNDSTSPLGSNIWRQQNSSMFEGDHCMYFSGTSGTNKKNDDWLISPDFTLNSNKIYRLKYYYRTDATSGSDYAVKISNSGITPADFTTTLLSKTNVRLTNYKSETIYISGYTGTINLAWHITTANTTCYFYLDLVTLEEVNCSEPLDIVINNTLANSISVTWQDNPGTAWEYYIQKTGLPTPTSTGIPTTNKTITVTHDNSGQALTPDTKYDVYVRSHCTNGVYTAWSEPILAKTQCNAYTIPFNEGFDSTSTSLNCWTIIDANQDATSTTNNNIWQAARLAPQDGDQTMSFFGNNSNTTELPHNDWLISPAINLDASKKYRVTFYYKTTGITTCDYEFAVLLSNQGTDLTNFTTSIKPKEKYQATPNWTASKGFITGVSGPVNLAWHLTSTTSTTYLYIDSVNIEEVLDCFEPTNIETSEISDTSASFTWTDQYNHSWNYYVQKQGMGVPNQNLASTSNQNNLTITQESNGTALTGSTDYEFWIQSTCDTNTKGEWTGPVTFTTACNPISTFPFTEGFNSQSPSFDCWTIVDQNKNALSPTGNFIWRQYNSGMYEGDRCMYIYESNSTSDDWLISPTFNLTAGIYKVSYYYKTHASYDISYELLLSTNGIDTSQFTTVLKPAKTERAVDYVKATYYITNTTGKVNLAWRLQYPTTTYMYIDQFEIDKVDCISPDTEVLVSNITSTSASFNWTDSVNSSWEYVTVPTASPLPIGTASTTQKSVNITQVSGGGGPLQPNTEYDFYVRSTCDIGKKSAWTGPVKFRTACSIQALPFWEGFNSDSTTLDCWKIVDNNKDATSTTTNMWYRNAQFYEGTHTMLFSGGSGPDKEHDDWLISPSFTFVANKYYKLTYHYKTTTSYRNDYDVLLSTTGDTPANFTKVLLSKTGDSNGTWTKESVVVGNTAGTVNFAWQIKTKKTATNLYIDNVFVEEIECPLPTLLPTTNITKNSATINWSEDFMSQWEYYVVPKGSPTPNTNTIGSNSSTKSMAITTDNLGNPLIANTPYTVYVRTICSTTEKSEWSIPIEFTTDCDVFALPFWEGFNLTSPTWRCWDIVDANNDATSPTSNNIWKTNTVYSEGDRSAYFIGYNPDGTFQGHDDWLITPLLTGTTNPNKLYRLKYTYRVADATTNEYEFEVLLSNKGKTTSNFTKIIKPKQKYTASNNWIEEYLFFTGVSADFHLAWHVTANAARTFLYIDNVFIEEVTGCPEPFPSSLNVTNIGEKTATLQWDDTMGGTAWEYYVQPKGNGIPTKNGILTTQKEATVTSEIGGLSLNANSEYEYYIRTICGNGEYSIWTGPFYFTTLCSPFTTPYWEGFNKDSTTDRCWTILDSSSKQIPLGFTWKAVNTIGNYYEGDQAWYYNIFQPSKKHNDWLISPKIELDGGNYIVKYHYKTNTTVSYVNEFEVLLSTNGTDPKDFTTTLIPSKVYHKGSFVEEVIFINGIKGDVNIAWHINAPNTNYSHLYFDNISIKKIETCPEPYYVKMTSSTETTMNIAWQQTGGITEWEVIVVNAHDDITATPIQTVTVNGTPNTTISGLQPGKVYDVYVRAKCNTYNTYSEYATKAHTYTRAGANNSCANAYTIPVNPTLDCVQKVSGSIVGAKASGAPEVECNKLLKNEVWYTFVATKDTHRFIVSDVVYNATVDNPKFLPTLYGAIYNVSCANLTTTPLMCFNSGGGGYNTILQDLVPGQRYYVRLGNYERVDKDGYLLEEQMDVTFTLCITTAEKDPLVVSASGDKYTYEELVKEVFVKSECDLVSNVKYQIGDGSPATQSINTLGYFNQGNSIFPFDEGIVLSTGEIDYVSGMFTSDRKGNNPHRWVGDKDLNDAINDAGGNPTNDGKMRVTQLEFDFTPIKDSIQFEYLFASNSYISTCTYTCKNGALFAAWLIDTETGEGQNLAKIKGTKTPISLGTIWDNTKITGSNCNFNPEYFWMNFTSHMDPMSAPINFAGMTVPMQSDMVYVEPGRKYHIKLAVMDFCDNISHTSAVFFKAGSFDLGDLNLGKDLLVSTNNALCDNETKSIHSGLGADPNIVTIKWYKDDVVIPGATSPALEVSESGIYKVTGYYNEIQCGVKGEVKVEMFPPIHGVVARPSDFDICRYAQPGGTLNLNEVSATMFADLDAETAANYKRTYYTDSELTQLILDSTAFEVDEIRTTYPIYILVEDLRTGCNEVFSFKIRGVAGDAPTTPENVTICSSYALPKLEDNQAYYTEAGAKGEKLKAGDVLRAGTHTIYVYQDNGNLCYEETSFTVEVVAMPYLHHIEDQTLQCELFVLPELPEFNQYFIEVAGKRVPLVAGTPITQTNTKVYIVVESEDKTCKAETSFWVRYDECPIPKGISPNGDGVNDAFDLTQHGVSSVKIFNRNGTEVYSFNGAYTNQWMGQSKNNKMLPSGTYYYVIQSFDKTRTGWVQLNF